MVDKRNKLNNMEDKMIPKIASNSNENQAGRG